MVAVTLVPSVKPMGWSLESVKLTAETPELFEVDASSLHVAQREWYAVQMEDLQAYLRASRGDETITCHPAWPVRR